MQFNLNFFFSFFECIEIVIISKNGMEKKDMRIYILKKETYNWVMWQVELLLAEQSHLIKGLKFVSSKLVESMATPVHGSPLIFHWFEFTEIPHFWNIVFSAAAAIIFTIKHHCDQSDIHPPKLPPFKSTILLRKKCENFIKLLY